MQRARRLPVSALNPHFTCVLCEGYIIDATTITECVHSFCRTCIVRYLEHNKYCPVCDAQVHETKPLQGIRFDQTLQDIVYKLIPGLYQNEMQTRRQFYAEHPDAAAHCNSEERGEGAEQKFFYSPDETISLTLEYHSGSKDSVVDESSETSSTSDEKNAMTRYLNCPAALAVSQLKKFISMKFSLPRAYQVEIMYADHVLRDDDTLMDIAYIYAWKRAGPMKFHYNITKRIPRRWEIFVPKISKPAVSAEPEPRQTVPDVSAVCSAVPEKAEEQQNELEKMEVDETSSEINPCSVELERLAALNHKPITNCDHPTTDPTSMEINQKIDNSDPVDVASTTSASPSTKQSLGTNGPMSYGTVKLVSTSDTNTILSTSNGVRLKLIHPPHTNPRGRPRKSKKKCKTAPSQKLARLAPYPPPSTVPSSCLATAAMPHLPPLTVGKLVPSVMTSLAPALVTTLVSSTANTLCNASRNTFVPQVAPFINQTNASTVTNAIGNAIVPAVLSNGLPENNSIQQSSTFAGQNACQSNVNSLPNHQTLMAIPPVNSPVISLPQVSSSVVAVDTKTSAKEETSPVVSEGTAPTSDISPSADSIEVDSTVKSDSVCGKDSLCDNSVSTTDAVSKPSLDTPTSISNSVQASLPASCDSEKKTACITQSVSSVDSSGKMECETSVNIVPNSVPTAGSEQTKSAESIPMDTSSVTTEVKLNGVVCNGVQTPSITPSLTQPMFCKSFSMDRKATEAYENSVKNSISAEFSDNDDLGCQPDLVVDEQKLDSSDNEDDADTALRKKINAIAEKEDEADATDDTEADSGRASDISSQARSSCDDDIGSPAAPVVSTNNVVVISSSSTQPPSFAAPVTTTSSVTPSPSSEESHRPAKTSSLNEVIDNLYRQKKDNLGALDLSTCARKSGEAPSSRPKAVANPVLDIKHRQQAYLPAPSKQHTACPPAPKHPTSPSLLMHHLSVHHQNIITAAQQMAQQHQGKAPHLHCGNMAYPSPPRSSPSSVAAKAAPIYNNSHAVVTPPVPTAHQGMVPFLPSSFLQYNPAILNSFAKGNIASMPLPGRSTPKTVQSSPPPNFQNKSPGSTTPHYGKQSSSPSSCNHRRSSSTTDSHLSKSPLSRGSPRSPPVIQVSHPRASPTLMRMLTQHRSASPAPCPKPLQTTTAQSSTPATSTSSSSSSSYKPSSSIPIYKKADSYKNYSSKFRGSNLTVYNPDPNGYRQKIVIKNLDRTGHR